MCAEPGDSGGSLPAGAQARGVTSGGSGNCRTGGTTYFHPVNSYYQSTVSGAHVGCLAGPSGSDSDLCLQAAPRLRNPDPDPRGSHDR